MQWDAPCQRGGGAAVGELSGMIGVMVLRARRFCIVCGPVRSGLQSGKNVDKAGSSPEQARCGTRVSFGRSGNTQNAL